MILDCDVCKVKVQAINIGEYVKQNSDDPIENVLYTFCKCPECSSPILAEQAMFFDGSDFDWSIPTKIFPNDQFYINPSIPPVLQKSLMESVKCYNANSFTACVIMCRRTIEGLCSNKGANNNNLGEALKKLKDVGVINEQLFEWANQLRLLGNDAAHKIDVEFTSPETKDILDFTIAILDFTYSFKDKFEKFKTKIEGKHKIVKQTF